MLKFFPFEITYRKKLKDQFNDFSTKQIMDYFIKDFQESGVKNIRRENNKIVADITFFGIRPGWNFNRWGGIGKCSVQIINIDNKLKRVAIYRFNLTRLLLIAGVLSLLFWQISQEWWAGLFSFGLFGVLNWTIKLLQHWITFYSIFSEMEYHGNKQLESEIKSKI